MKTTHLLFGAIISAGLYSCSGKPDPGSQNDTSQIAKEPIDTAIVANTTMNDFATKAAIGGMMEVESSAKMIKFTENPDIQTLATMMVKDHGAANAELKAIAKNENLNIPQALPAEKTQQLDKLSVLKEEEANRYYADLMVKEHHEAIALFTKASQDEPSAALKAFAAKHLPILKAHATHAEHVNKIVQSIKNDKGDAPLKIANDRNN